MSTPATMSRKHLAALLPAMGYLRKQVEIETHPICWLLSMLQDPSVCHCWSRDVPPAKTAAIQLNYVSFHTHPHTQGESPYNTPLAVRRCACIDHHLIVCGHALNPQLIVATIPTARVAKTALPLHIHYPPTQMYTHFILNTARTYLEQNFAYWCILRQKDIQLLVSSKSRLQNNQTQREGEGERV